jgi:hypothetical protein
MSESTLIEIIEFESGGLDKYLKETFAKELEILGQNEEIKKYSLLNKGGDWVEIRKI